MKVLTIGGATQDIIIEYQEGSALYIQDTDTPKLGWKEGSKVTVEKLSYATGGGATNSAVSFQRLSHDVSSCFKIGNDPAGDCIIQDLESHKIDINVSIDKSEKTGTSFIIPTPNKDRIIFAYPGANLNFNQKEIPENLIASQDCVYITSLHGSMAESLPYITRTAHKMIEKKGLRVAVNPGASQLKSKQCGLKASLPYIDMLILNSEEMRLFMESLKPRFFQSTGHGLIPDGPKLSRSILSHNKITFTLHEYFAEIFSYGVKRAVVTDGKNGVYVATQDALYFHPSIPVEVTNSLGAGDAFGSCLIASLLDGNHIEQAITLGVINAASVIQHMDAQSGLLTKKELLKEEKNLDESLIVKHPISFN